MAFRLTQVPTLLLRAADFSVTGGNEALVRVFGFNEETILGRNLAEAGLWADDAARLRF